MFSKHKHQSYIIFPVKIKISGETIYTWSGFYQSQFWRAYKILARTKISYKCHKCNCRTNLQLHHKSYRDLTEFNFRRVTWSCKKHH